jgi:hypothetical protein
MFDKLATKQDLQLFAARLLHGLTVRLAVLMAVGFTIMLTALNAFP